MFPGGMMDNEVKIRRGDAEKVLMMRRPPSVGSWLTVEGEHWLVLSVSYVIPYRVPVRLGRQQAA